jgi:hypothetical protein
MSEVTTRFVRGNDHLHRLLADPEAAADVATTRAEIREMDLDLASLPNQRTRATRTGR